MIIQNLDNDFLYKIKFISEHFKIEFESEFDSNPNFSEKKVIEFINNNPEILYVQVYDWNQKLIYSSTRKTKLNISELFSHSTEQSLDDSIYIKRFLVRDNLELMNAFMVFNMSSFNEKKSEIISKLYVRSFICLIAISVIVFFFSKFLEKPLLILRNETDLMSKGYFDFKIKETIGTKEINQIAKNINIITEGIYFSQNVLIDELRSTTKGISIQNEELKQAKENAERANKIKSEFIANVTHEIRTPMNTIIGLTEFLKSKSEIIEDQSYYDAILKSGKTLLNFINEILDISKIEAGKLKIEKKSINLKHLTEEINDIFKINIHNKGLEFIFIYDEQIPKLIFFDEVRLKQVLINLLNNSLKFTENGYISLVFENVSENLVNGTFDLKIKVKDTGIGMDLNDGRNIFEPFTQKEVPDSKKFSGSGLGLAISKQIIELMNGKIDVNSLLNKGSEFEIIFSDVEIDFENKDTKEIDNSDLFNLPEATILLAEPIELNRILISDMFKSTNLHFLHSDSGQKTIETAETQIPDLILLDTHISGPDFIEVMKQLKLKNLTKKIPVIATSTYILKSERDRLLNFGFENVILKPIDNIHLIHTFKTYLKSEKDNRKFKDENSNNLTSSTESDENQLNFTDKMEFMLKFSHKAAEISENLILSEAKNFCNELVEYNSGKQSILISHFIDELSDGIEKFKLEKVKQILKKIESMESKDDKSI